MKFSAILFLFIASLSHDQSNLQLDLTFGDYFNDQNAKKFHVRERRWMLNEGELIYLNDNNNERYSDTLKLNSNDIDSISILINTKKLNKYIEKNYEAKHLKYSGHSAIIKGTITKDNKEHKIIIRGHSTLTLADKPISKEYKELEYLFYQIIKRYE